MGAQWRDSPVDMLYFYSGTDREKARTAMNAAAKKVSKNIVRITDTNVPADLAAAVGGGGMFHEPCVVVLNGVLGSEEMRAILLDALAYMRDSEETFFILEEKPDAATRKQSEKYAERSERYDKPSEKKGGDIFAIAGALRRGGQKKPWGGYTT